ncbi:MAG: hypothetical protein JNL38_25795, partial [Myxococcales bacterium]|nr:hypothetical protein [Myxococcales bacterium]
ARGVADVGDEIRAAAIGDRQSGTHTSVRPAAEAAPPSSRRPRRRAPRIAWFAAAAALLAVGVATAREVSGGALQRLFGAEPAKTSAEALRPNPDAPRSPALGGASDPAPRLGVAAVDPAGPNDPTPHAPVVRVAPPPVRVAPASSAEARRDPEPASPPAVVATAAPASSESSPPVGSRSTVEVGIIHTNGVSAIAVRSKLRSLQGPLSSCYRAELSQVPDPGTRTATLHLSVDERGRVTSCGVSGAEALPDTARCFQRTMVGQDLGSGAMQAKLGAAEAWLTLSPL